MLKNKHNLPDVLVPAGDVCYPLFIPDDAGYRRLVLGTLSQLLNEDYYEESAYDLNSVRTVIDEWRNRVLVPFVQGMNDDNGCSGDSGLVATQKTAQRTTEINFTANLDVPVIWNSGDYDTTNNSRVYADSAGIGIVTGGVHIATISTANLQYAMLRRNGTEILTRSHLQVGLQNGEYSLSWQDEVANGDYFELVVRASTNSKVSVLIAMPRIGLTVIG